MQEGIYAKFHTTRGEILVKLTHEKTPGTVGNFVALAEGDPELEAALMKAWAEKEGSPESPRLPKIETGKKVEDL